MSRLPEKKTEEPNKWAKRGFTGPKDEPPKPTNRVNIIQPNPSVLGMTVKKEGSTEENIFSMNLKVPWPDDQEEGKFYCHGKPPPDIADLYNFEKTKPKGKATPEELEIIKKVVRRVADAQEKALDRIKNELEERGLTVKTTEGNPKSYEFFKGGNKLNSEEHDFIMNEMMPRYINDELKKTNTKDLIVDFKSTGQKLTDEKAYNDRLNNLFKPQPQAQAKVTGDENKKPSWQNPFDTTLTRK